MGRSSRSKADENRALIVEAASSLFRAKGFDAVGIADVMRAAGMTQGGFYKHFPSKDALAAEACMSAFETAAVNWRGVARKARTEGRDVAAAIAEHYATVRPPGQSCPMIAFASDAARRSGDDPMQRSFRDGIRTLFDTFAELVGGDGSPEADARLRARFAAMVGSTMLAWSVQRDDWSAARGEAIPVAAVADNAE